MNTNTESHKKWSIQNISQTQRELTILILFLQDSKENI